MSTTTGGGGGQPSLYRISVDRVQIASLDSRSLPAHLLLPDLGLPPTVGVDVLRGDALRALFGHVAAEHVPVLCVRHVRRERLAPALHVVLEIVTEVLVIRAQGGEFLRRGIEIGYIQLYQADHIYFLQPRNTQCMHDDFSHTCIHIVLGFTATTM